MPNADQCQSIPLHNKSLFGSILISIDHTEKKEESVMVVRNSAKHDYEGKSGSPTQKRADFQNYSPRELFWLSFFSQCSIDWHWLLIGGVL